MDEPRAEQIASAAAELLRGITRGAGYWTDLGRNISRRRWLVTDLDRVKIPCASVWSGEAKPAPEACMGSWRETLTLMVELWARADRVELVDTEVLRAQADVRRRLLATHNLGLDFVVGLRPARVRTDHQEFADNKLGWKAVAFEVDYDYSAATP